jgi:RNA polymerase sigma-70 factor (ECF subfamily)
VDNYGDALYGFALTRVRNEEVAQEMVQETFLAALKAKDRFQGRSSEKTWLISILKNKIFDYFGKVSRERAFNAANSTAEPRDDFFDGAGNWINGPVRWPDDPHKLLEQREFFEVFGRCLSKLPPRLAQAFILREMEGLEGKAICEIMDISANNLWVMLYRARLHLRSYLEEAWLNDGGKEDAGSGREDT